MVCTGTIHRASLEDKENGGFEGCSVNAVSVGLSAGLLRVVGSPVTVAGK